MKVGETCSRSQRGYTLIEMLVVISIIALLAALIFPVFSRVRMRAQQVRCLNQGKQLGLATLMYVQDYDGRVMRTLSPQEMNTVVNTWRGEDFRPSRWMVRYFVMPNYVKNEEIWVCPTAYRWMERFAYGYKMTWKPRLDGPAGDAFGDPPCAGYKLTQIEKRDGPLYKRIMWFCQAYGDLAPKVMPGADTYYPHNKGTNYIYLDGHAEWRPVGHYWAPPGYPAPGMNPPVN